MARTQVITSQTSTYSSAQSTRSSITSTPSTPSLASSSTTTYHTGTIGTPSQRTSTMNNTTTPRPSNKRIRSPSSSQISSSTTTPKRSRNGAPSNTSTIPTPTRSVSINSNSHSQTSLLRSTSGPITTTTTPVSAATPSASQNTTATTSQQSRDDRIRILGDEIMGFGKYSSRTRKWVYENYPDYCNWALGQRGFSELFRVFVQYVTARSRNDPYGLAYNDFCDPYFDNEEEYDDDYDGYSTPTRSIVTDTATPSSSSVSISSAPTPASVPDHNFANQAMMTGSSTTTQSNAFPVNVQMFLAYLETLRDPFAD